MSMSLYYFIFPPNFYPETKCRQLFETIIELDYPDQYKIEDFEENTNNYSYPEITNELDDNKLTHKREFSF